MFTLRDWQLLSKPKDELLYNCSEFTHKNDEFVLFPIGMQVGYINSCDNFIETQIGTHENLVLCAINTETDQRRRPSGINRKSIIKTLQNTLVNQYIPSSTYFRILPSYKFVISPEGNGIDCHRHYEALMAGCIPIVEESEMIRNKYGKCPILYTHDYSEITPEYLERAYQTMVDSYWDFSRILLSSYCDDIQKQIKDNGNYWGMNCIGRQWYYI